MKNDELLKLQEEIKFDAPSMAACLGIPYQTYRNYIYGANAIPERIKRAVLELRQINITFNEGFDARMDEAIKKNPSKFNPNLSLDNH